MKIEVLIFVMGAIALFSCNVEMYNKEQVKRAAVKNQKKQETIIQENGNILILTSKGSSDSLMVVEQFEFDENNAQIKCTVKASCKSCFQKVLREIINDPAYLWRKVNDSTYISRQKLKRMLTIYKASYSFEISKHTFTNSERKTMTKNKFFRFYDEYNFAQ
jgi:hypothetical protein